jgi:hypothetical protein
MPEVIYHKKDHGIEIKDAEGNLMLSVAKITDGTIDTTFKGIKYGYIKDGQVVRDDEGRVKYTVHETPIFEPGRKRLDNGTIPDVEDVFVWYVDHTGTEPKLKQVTHPEFKAVLEDFRNRSAKSFEAKKLEDSNLVKEVAREVIASAKPETGKKK